MEEKELQLNAKLQQKKNALRKELAEKGILKKEGENTYDKYKYFSEAQYKNLFTGLFSKYGIELKSTMQDYATFQGSGKMVNGRFVKMRFTLIDTETGFEENTDIVGEGLDNGDKAMYKAYTGALKYFLASTFMVATGDDPEKDSNAEDDKKPQRPTPTKSQSVKRAIEPQLFLLNQLQDEKIIAWIKAKFQITDYKELSFDQANQLIDLLNAKGVLKHE